MSKHENEVVIPAEVNAATAEDQDISIEAFFKLKTK